MRGRTLRVQASDSMRPVVLVGVTRATAAVAARNEIAPMAKTVVSSFPGPY